MSVIFEKNLRETATFRYTTEDSENTEKKGRMRWIAPIPLTKQATFEDFLQGPPPIQNAMNENLSAHDLIDKPVRLEMDFPVAVYADTLKFGRTVASTGHIGQAMAGLLDFSQQMISPATPIGSQDIFVDVENVLFGLCNH